MEQTSTPGQHIPTWDEIMTMIYETRRITRENAEDFDRRMKEAEQARLKNQEEYELLKKEGERVRQKSQEDFDRRMKESDEKFEKSLQKSREDFDRSLQASREDFDRRMKEEEKARQKYREEYERESKKTDKIIRKMSENFISQSGHIVEGLMEPCAMKIFQDYGFDLDKCWKNMEGRDKTTGKEMEVDLFLHDTTDSIAVEVKIHCTKKKIVHFLEQMQMFKRIFTEFAQNKIYVAIAAINFDKEAVAYAKENGVFLIHCNDDVFTLEPMEKEKLLTF